MFNAWVLSLFKPHIYHFLYHFLFAKKSPPESLWRKLLTSAPLLILNIGRYNSSKHFLKKEVDYEKIGVAACHVPYPGKLVCY